MTAGIIIYGSNGKVQIDSDYQNLFLAASGTGGTIPSSSGFSDAAVCASAPSSVSAPTMGSSAGSGVKWWIFDTIGGSIPSHGYGLIVANSSNKVVFDATKKPLRISGDIEGSSKIGVTTTFPSGRTYAVIQASVGGRFTEGSQKAGNGQWKNHYKREIVGFKVSSNKITTDWFTANETLTTDPDQHYDQGSKVTGIFDNVSFIVVDVTNY